jgi:hypothetical protein
MVALRQYPCQPARCEHATFRIVKGRAMTPHPEESAEHCAVESFVPRSMKASMAYLAQSSDSLAFDVLQCAMPMTTHCAPDRGRSAMGAQHTRKYSIPSKAPNFSSLLETRPTPTAQ